ncbi:hypothetical protein PV327_009466 [Microctonus hyperodae]|uniref:Uncharacterized protein n=1 Tax=Microctonus hyperodae TaxID=165561 RepID=A0AA39FTV4_MICHY|nr:hypothetical protein PV327_009466 [Microctonus hyperodae]
MDSRSLLTVKPTLARRVSDLFKADGNNNGTPLIFSNSSMKKLRHCCQNVGLFPYLLYSLGNSKFNDNNKLNWSLIITRITEKIFLLYGNIRQTIRYHSNFDKIYQKSICHNVEMKQSMDTDITLTNVSQNVKKFDEFYCEKRESSSLLMIISVYIAMVILIAQLIGIISLIFTGKFTPGFVFLVCSLLCLGYIIMKVLLCEDSFNDMKKRGKRKVE